ncbi:ABC transporter permease subunit [Paenibacillus sp. WQ 127069]|uniref:ABC transporter permease subunit n=1 Tax=Paenibacillus baimaensis TaxID=2982185 RepID=A0ABT2USZ9_9BACL|nr:ABC transporter permease subunit [Paenibacillus sp. WQ 127069]MCU6797762.1 ABC transporter permease subunit [Paenibacillus sp. WQ 127069]
MQNVIKKTNWRKFLLNDLIRNKLLYVMMLPALIYYIIFHYGPMYGAIIAFKEYTPSNGIMNSEWVGLANFQDFFSGFYFWRIFKNTLLISLYSLIFGFPAPILLALFINELRSQGFKRIVQSVTYMPYFISLIVVCGIIKDFTNSGGLINTLVSYFGSDGKTMLQNPNYFRPIYILSEIWQHFGWESIIYLAALSGIDQEQYEAARIDGAGRWRQMLNITIPGILPTITILLILRMGNLLNVGFEKIILLYNPSIYETADVIASYVYRKGLIEFNWSFSAAVGLFNSLINLVLLVTANYISRKTSENSLW